MSNLARLSFSLEQPLLERLEKLLQDTSYENRSEFIRDMIRQQLVDQEWERNEIALGTITMLYDHHMRQLSEKLTDLQHDYHEAVLASTHVHLTHHLCAEMIMVKGSADVIRGLANSLRQQKGVLHATLSMSSTGEKLQ